MKYIVDFPAVFDSEDNFTHSRGAIIIVSSHVAAWICITVCKGKKREIRNMFFYGTGWIIGWLVESSVP